MNDLETARNIIDTTDREMARLFAKRMDAARLVAAYKQEHGLQITDPEREKAILVRNQAYIENEDYRAYYAQFMQTVMALSRAYQSRLMDSEHNT